MLSSVCIKLLSLIDESGYAGCIYFVIRHGPKPGSHETEAEALTLIQLHPLPSTWHLQSLNLPSPIPV